MTYTSASSAYLGSFSVTVGDDTTGDGAGRIDWNFDVVDSDIDYLAAGQTLTQTYTVTVSDGEGGTVDQDIIITLTGTNDAPTITAATNVTGDITEIVDNDAGELTSPLSDSGSFTISDAVSDTQSVTFASAGSAYLGSFSATVGDNTTADGSGRIDWNFDVADSDIDYLAAGQTLTQTYTVTVDDSIGGTVDQDIVITLTGTNDAPIISSIINITGAITEITDGGSGENVTVHVESGSFVITDQDITDSHFVSVSANGSDYRGNLSPSINNITGQVDWDFEVSDGDIDYLAAGQTLTQTYTVTVSDGAGGSVDQDIVITLTGTNDAPTITAATNVTGDITEIVDNDTG
ncbi:VCBS domain-containing protein, partial [Endozoicomonas ascidiicola]|uniref:VCBS domain-containing protein n=1 Tax=Endozoicomonas ascidiicola TaxID=1698521 RepID=UPI001C12B2BB